MSFEAFTAETSSDVASILREIAKPLQEHGEVYAARRCRSMAERLEALHHDALTITQPIGATLVRVRFPFDNPPVLSDEAKKTLHTIRNELCKIPSDEVQGLLFHLVFALCETEMR